MCGIIGFVCRTGDSGPLAVSDAIATIRKRGPDHIGQTTIQLSGYDVGLYHTRLSIIDVDQSSNQPMTTADGQYSIVFNGEIYNYIELKEKYLSYTELSSSGDTEVLLNCWEQLGDGVCKELRGMYAFAVLDKFLGILKLIRDPFGVKPLYYYLDEKYFVFGSTPGSVAKLLGIANINLQSAYAYVVNGEYDASEDTFIDGVKSVRPGEILSFSIKRWEIKKRNWYNYDARKVISNPSYDVAKKELRDKVISAVELNLRADVPLCLSLSGGIDSSIILGIVTKILGKKYEVFSYVSDDEKSEELWIDLVADFNDVKPNKIRFNHTDLYNDLPELLEAQGEPFGGTSIYAQFCIYREISKKGYKVVLDGQGADELFGGYYGYPGPMFRSILARYGLGAAIKFLYKWSRWPGRNLTKGLMYVVSEYASDDFFHIFRSVYGKPALPGWIDEDSIKSKHIKLGQTRYFKYNGAANSRLVDVLSRSVQTRGLPALLRHADRNSMFFSLESRVPFLDPDVMEYAYSLPDDYHISLEGRSKALLKDSFADILPEPLYNRRDKVGFEAPRLEFDSIASHLYRRFVCSDIEILNSRVDRDEFNDYFRKKHDDDQVWRVLNLLLWREKFAGCNISVTDL